MEHAKSFLRRLCRLSAEEKRHAQEFQARYVMLFQKIDAKRPPG